MQWVPYGGAGSFGEENSLAGCYATSLELANEIGLRSVAFPCISTGVFGYPVELAAKTAVNTVVETLARLNCQIDVTFCCFSAGDRAVYERILAMSCVGDLDDDRAGLG